MPVAQQNALVQKYCAVCHTDASQNGGLTLQHFDAAHPDPGVAAMMLGKLKTGALGAAGIDYPTMRRFRPGPSATAAEATGAHRWQMHPMEDLKTKASILTASIVRDVPSKVSKDVPDSYRLIVSCRPDTRDARIDLAWSPRVSETRSGAVRARGREEAGDFSGGRHGKNGQRYEGKLGARLHPALSRRKESPGGRSWPAIADPDPDGSRRLAEREGRVSVQRIAASRSSGSFGVFQRRSRRR